jgi:two-component system OmpR family response regulator
MSAVRILHVDDEPDIREIVGMSLGLDEDFEVRHCACGADAVAIAAEWSPFLILLDAVMPVMDGPTTLMHLRTDPRTADIPVLFMTARVNARDIEHFVSLGAQGFISKPFDPMELAAVVRSRVQAIRQGHSLTPSKISFDRCAGEPELSRLTTLRIEERSPLAHDR